MFNYICSHNECAIIGEIKGSLKALVSRPDEVYGVINMC